MSRAFRRARTGGSLLEFALLLPVFTALVLGTIDAGDFLYQRLALELALETGCRAGALVDPGQGFSNWSGVTTAAHNSMLATLHRYGMECGDCETTLALDTSTTTESLECSISRTSTTISGTIPSAVMSGHFLSRLEMQR